MNKEISVDSLAFCRFNSCVDSKSFSLLHSLIIFSFFLISISFLTNLFLTSANSSRNLFINSFNCILSSYNCSRSILLPIPLFLIWDWFDKVYKIGGGVSFGIYLLKRFRWRFAAELGLNLDDFLDDVFKVYNLFWFIFIFFK